jgi:GABA(A) receptor-associated protein
MKHFKFQKEHKLDKRKAESARILKKYPDKIPCIVETYTKTDFELDKNKYLIPCDLNMGQFVYVLRKRIKLSSDEATFLFIYNENNKPILSSSTQLIKTVYDEHKMNDGFLYCIISKESTFG